MKTDELIRMGVPVQSARTMVGSVAATVAAAGSDQAGATALTGITNRITSGSGGVRLPAGCQPGDRVVVINDMGGSLNVYPQTGGSINDAAANAALAFGDNTAATFICASATLWLTVPRVPS